jgi:pimeloyl-ACP methyl ester carboxylesterase
MPHADVNGQRLHYEEAGSGAPAILFSHGLFMDHTMFAPQLDAFSGEHRCVAWNERGHGATESTPDAFTYWDSADDAVALLDHLGIERAVFAGMSQGGFLSLRAALAHPERVQALILIDTQAGVEDPEKLAGYDQLLQAWTGPDGLPQEIADIVAGLILGAPDHHAEWQAKWRAMDHERVRQVYATLVGRDDITDRLGEIAVPALVVHGSADAAIGVEDAQRMADGLPDAELVLIEGAGHAANLTHPDAVNPHIARFLAGLRAGA